MPEATSRRALLRLLAVGGAAGLAGLAGCELPQVRRNSDPDEAPGGSTAGPVEPGPAVVPTDVADVLVLEAALRRSRELVALARRARPGGSSTAGPVLRTARETLATQADVLRQLLEAADVPVPTEEPKGGRGGDDASTSGPDDPRPPARRLGRVLRTDVARPALEELASVSSANLAMLTSVTAQRGALSTLLGADPRWEPLAGPTGQPAASMLDSFRPAVYAFEVLAARAGGADREAYEATLGELRRVTRMLTELAGSAAPPAPLGYGLPDGLGNPDRRRALAGEMLGALPPAVVRDAGGHTGDVAAVAGTVQVLATSLALGHEWGAPVAAFPGMTLP